MADQEDKRQLGGQEEATAPHRFQIRWGTYSRLRKVYRTLAGRMLREKREKKRSLILEGWRQSIQPGR